MFNQALQKFHEVWQQPAFNAPSAEQWAIILPMLVLAAVVIIFGKPKPRKPKK